MFNRELIKGSTSLLLLQLLSEKDMYGYELVKVMEVRSDAHLSFKEGTLYPALHKLEDQGLIVSYWKAQEKGPDRKYYAITEEGKEILKNKTSEWKQFIAVIAKVMRGQEHEA